MKNNKIKAKIAKAFEVPKEIVTDMPKITWYGTGDLLFENYIGIIEYKEITIRINTVVGIYRLEGKHLEICEITNEDILIKGNIESINVDMR